MVSALPSQPDIDGPSRYVSFVPQADIDNRRVEIYTNSRPSGWAQLTRAALLLLRRQQALHASG